MIPGPTNKRSQLFTLRIWTEETAEGRTEWRGKVERVVSGETLYFREWDTMLAFLCATPSSAVEGAESAKREQAEEGEQCERRGRARR